MEWRPLQGRCATAVGAAWLTRPPNEGRRFVGEAVIESAGRRITYQNRRCGPEITTSRVRLVRSLTVAVRIGVARCPLPDGRVSDWVGHPGTRAV